MSITLSLSSETENALRRRAEAAGKSTDDYVTELVEQAVARPTLRQILAPIHEEVAASAMSDPELNALLQTSLDATRRDRRSESHQQPRPGLSMFRTGARRPRGTAHQPGDTG